MRSRAEGILGMTARREKKGISLEQISQSTKIGIRALQAIEAGDFEKLPGGIYNTSYIRQYAKAVDIDESEILTEYYSVTGLSAEPENPAGSQASEKNLFSRVLRHTSTVFGSL